MDWRSGKGIETFNQGYELQGNLRGDTKLTQEQKRQLWSILEQALAQDAEEESPELLTAIDEGIRSLESGERTYTIEKARQLVAETVAKARR